MTIEPVRVGVVGCGNISNAYFKANEVFESIDMIAVADLDLDRARSQADKWEIPTACSVDELMANDDVELVLNLTTPLGHAPVNTLAIENGKHTYVEKPFALTSAEGNAVVKAAAARGLLVGGAPDTFLGDGGQTCRRLIDAGTIGEPIAAVAFMVGHGHENWHPSPEFYYQVGGGPLFDMGPYYLTALVNLMGPIASVSSSARATFPTRTITSEPKNGTVIPVATPTHISTTLNFASQAIGTMIMSFDVWQNSLPRIEIYGTEGTICVPDPNGFGGEIRASRERDEWEVMPLTTGHPEYQRGAGLADMAYAIRSGRKFRADGALVNHVLEAMESVLASADAGAKVELQSSCERPAAIVDGQPTGTFEE